MTFHKDKNCETVIYSNPEIHNNDSERFYAALDTINLPNTFIVDFPLMISFNVEGGMTNKSIQPFLPNYQRLTEYRNGSLSEQLAFINDWSIHKIIPVITAYEKKVDRQFEGVLSLGNALQGTDFSKPIDVAKLTTYNPSYWRAMLEMNKGNQLIPLTKIMLLASQNNLDYARKYSEILVAFSQKGGVADDYLKEFNFNLSVFNETLGDEVEEGIRLHDQQNYVASINKFDSILQVYPNSAWTLHERYLSKSISHLSNNETEELKGLWNKTRKEIFKINPLYGYDLQMSNQKEAYSYYLRQQIGELFKANGDQNKDLYKYADIALKLKDYDFAAHLYWQLFSRDMENKIGLNRFLYCLEKLGIDEIKKNFKGNFEKEFNSIDKQLNEDFNNNSFIQKFNK